MVVPVPGDMVSVFRHFPRYQGRFNSLDLHKILHMYIYTYSIIHIICILWLDICIYNLNLLMLYYMSNSLRRIIFEGSTLKFLKGYPCCKMYLEYKNMFKNFWILRDISKIIVFIPPWHLKRGFRHLKNEFTYRIVYIFAWLNKCVPKKPLPAILSIIKYFKYIWNVGNVIFSSYPDNINTSLRSGSWISFSYISLKLLNLNSLV